MKQYKQEIKRTAAIKENKQNSAPRTIRKIFPLLWYTLIAFILFGQTITFDYTYLDDQTLVLEQMHNLQSPSSVIRAFSEDAFHAPSGKGYYYRPALTISFIADAMIGKGSFAVFHISNIIFHILSTYLLFLFFIRIGFNRMLSFLAGVAFLVHPMVTQAVAWIPGRNDTLLAIFALAGILFWMKYLENHRITYLLFHLLFFALALITKENALAISVLCLFYSLAIKRLPLKKHLLPVAGWVILTMIWFLLRQNALYSQTKAPFSDQLFSMLKNLPALLPFLGKVFFPFDLSVFPILADMKVSIILGIIAIAGMVIMMIRTKPKEGMLWSFSLLWYLLFLLPSFISIGNQTPNFSEHRSYLAMAGVFIFILSLKPVRNADLSRLVPASLMVGSILLFGALTFFHSRNFKNKFSFWNNAVISSPSNAFNYNNLGAMYYLDGNSGQAELYFRKALAINPLEPKANSNTGLICMNTKRPAEAEKYYLEEIRINPAYDNAYFNLGLLYAQHARYEEAVSWWEKTLTINPKYKDAYRMLLLTYKNMERQADYEKTRLRAEQAGIVIQ